MPGGGANAVNNLADLGVNVLPVGAIGDDEAGRLLLKFFRHRHIAVSGVLKDKSYTTVTKTRILAGMTHNTRQQVVRVDREPEAAPNSHLTRELFLAAREYIRASDALLVSDYGYGSASPAIVNVLRAERAAKRRPVDPRFALPPAGIFRRDRGDTERARSGGGSRRANRTGLGKVVESGRQADRAHESAVAAYHTRARRHGRIRSKARAGGYSNIRLGSGRGRNRRRAIR